MSDAETLPVKEKENYSLIIHTSLHKFCLCVSHTCILNLQSNLDYAKTHGNSFCIKNLLINPDQILFMEYYEIADSEENMESKNERI